MTVGAKAGVVWSCAEEGTAAALGHSSASEYFRVWSIMQAL